MSSDLEADVDALDRVLFRLANLDDERMVHVLHSLLPQLLTLFPRSLDTPLHVQLHDKLVQVVTHVRTRLVLLNSPLLPLEALADVLAQSNLSVFSYNLALLFLELGFSAASVDTQAHILMRLLPRLASVSTRQQETILRLFVRTLPVPASVVLVCVQKNHDVHPATGPTSLDVLLDFLLDLVLDVVPASNSATSVAFGLSPSRLERLERVHVSTDSREQLVDRQLHALRLVRDVAAIPSTRKLELYLAACASGHHAIKTFADAHVARVMHEDPDALEHGRTMRRVMTFVLGSPVVSPTADALDAADALVLSHRARFADASVLKSLTVLSASVAATNTFPWILQVLCQGLFGREATRAASMASKIHVASLELCQWTLQQCEQALLETVLGPVLFPTLVRQLTSVDTAEDVETHRTWRHGIYRALSILAHRSPALVASSDKAFELLLAQALDPEVDGEAIQTFTSFASAYAAGATADVRTNVTHALLALLHGAKIFEPAYARVRAALGQWCVALVTSAASDAPDVALRFAAMRLKTDADDATRHIVDHAVFASPLPSLRALAQGIQAAWTRIDRTTCVAPSIVATCLDLCVQVLEKAEKREDPADWTCVVEFLTQTLVDEQVEPRSLVLETAAKALARVCHLNAECVCAVVARHGTELVELFTKSHDRTFLLHLASLVTFMGRSQAFPGGEFVSTFIVHGPARVDDGCSPEHEAAGVAYMLGSVIACIASDEWHEPRLVSNEHVLGAFGKLIHGLDRYVKMVTSSPRARTLSEHMVTVGRSFMDGIGLCGPLTTMLASATGADWLQLKVQALETFQRVLEWDSRALGLDELLDSNVRALKRVAIENLGHMVATVPAASVSCHWSNGVTKILNVLLEMEHDEMELDFCVGDALVALGNDALGTSETAPDPPLARVLLERVLTRGAAGGHRKQQRKATIWLVCMCAAGLTSVRPSPSWQRVFQSSDVVVNVHDFFVSMVNEAHPTIVESAVKGLAYLGLGAPTDQMGRQLREHLFRHLRCFRAVNDGAPADDERASTRAGATVVVANAAYREMGNVCAAVGKPKLVYTLLYLSTTEEQSSGATMVPAAPRAGPFAFATLDHAFRATVIEQARQDWHHPDRALPSKLLPWFFLLTFHSERTIAATMKRLWVCFRALDPPDAPQWSQLFEFAVSRLERARHFKYREAACGALMALLRDAREMEDVRGDVLRRLWPAVARAVDDGMEAVASAGVKLFRAVSDTSVRLCAHDAAVHAPVLDALLDGMASPHARIQSLSLDALLRLCKTLPATALAPRLARCLLHLLASLSSLELPLLQYAQFHVDKKDELERVRVSLSAAGPVGQLIELLTHKLCELAKAARDDCLGIVDDELVAGLTTLLKRGVGLNTRVGTANLVGTLARDLPSELRHSHGAEKLLRHVLIPYVASKTCAENERYDDAHASREADASRGSITSHVHDGVVVQSYCRAAAALCAIAEPTTTKEYVEHGIFSATSKCASVSTSRFLLVSALATSELVQTVPPVAGANSPAWYCTHVFPAAFIGHFAASSVLQQAWQRVLDALPPSIASASTSVDALLTASRVLVVHPAWETRRQAARALQATFDARAHVSAELVAQVWHELLATVPGRLWRGKGVILDTLASLAAVKMEMNGEDLEWIETLAHVLGGECHRAWHHDDVAYLESAIVSLGKVGTLLSAAKWQVRASMRRSLQTLVETWTTTTRAVPPLLVKCVFEALARTWSLSTAHTDDGADTIAWLCTCVEAPSFTAWSSRRAMFETLATVVTVTRVEALVERTNKLVERVVATCCGPWGVADANHAKVRSAAADALRALLQRGNESAKMACALVLEQERVLAAVQTLRRSDDASDQQSACKLQAQELLE